jgi:hypothetical protein
MNKNIIIVTLIFITILSLVYAFLQQTAARASRTQAENNAQAAIESRAIADRLGAESEMLVRNCSQQKEKLLDSIKTLQKRKLR